MTPDLLRETLKEVLYGPDLRFGLGTGLFSEKEAGLLRAAHALTYAQAVTPAAPGRPSAAGVVIHLRQHLDHAAALLRDPYALRADEPEAWEHAPPTEREWRGELVGLAQAGQALYEALFLPLDSQGLRTAYAAVLHAAYHTGALRFYLGNLQAGQG
ncbi:hypothetical protein [Deinococcus hohokamensis]|uniref:DinB-like domain-containing protein n=1 Tax=Deinococcus hohokamensis TaxID=309883 RepID=A0ABV9I7G8_9DEIO